MSIQQDVYVNLKGEEDVIFNTSENKIEEDNLVNESLDTKTIMKMIGLDGVRQGSDNTFSVAILDTGTFPYKDLSYPNQKIISFKDFVNDINRPYDDNGHGTAVAGLIVGNNSNYQGVAPFVDIVSVKVMDYKGQGYKDTLLKGIQWVLDNKDIYNIKIMNISIGIPTEGYDEISKKIEDAYNSGIFVVTSSGNDGEGIAKMYSPAVANSAIASGSIDEQDVKTNFDYNIADFSVAWDTPNGKSKPDVFAPGKNILTIKGDIFYKGDGVINNKKLYDIGSGTSLSSAIVTGFVANLMNLNPNLSVEEIKTILYKNCVEIYVNGETRKFIYYKGEGNA